VIHEAPAHHYCSGCASAHCSGCASDDSSPLPPDTLLAALATLAPHVTMSPKAR
jgi:hypothetical protein